VNFSWENAVVIQNWVMKSAKKQENEDSLTIKTRSVKQWEEKKSKAK